MIKYCLLPVFAFIIPAMVLFSGTRSIVAESGTKSSYEAFLENPSLPTWLLFEEAIRSGRYDTSNRVFRDILEYHDARLKRDLPNSMSLVGITPRIFIEKQQRRTNSALNSIKFEESNTLWLILQKLAIQDFDGDLMWTACEITARLSPSKFESIAVDIQRRYPDKKQMIIIIHNKWLNRK